MSKRVKIALLLTILLLGILNLLPSGRGVGLPCDYNTVVFQKTYGFPFTYAKSKVAGGCENIKYSFNQANFAVDAAIALGVLVFEYAFLVKKKAKHA